VKLQEVVPGYGDAAEGRFLVEASMRSDEIIAMKYGDSV
jgi:hypothetical protein